MPRSVSAPRLQGALARKASFHTIVDLAAALLLLASTAAAQFNSTAPLVVAPTTITDSKGRYVEGLNAEDLILYDDNVPQKTQMDWSTYPISLVVAVQTSANSGAVIDKLGGSGILFTELLAADAGETAVLSFSDSVKVRQDFTTDPHLVTHSLKMMRMDGGGAQMLDAMNQALQMLEQRPPGRRRILLIIAERRDRGSIAKLTEVMERVQRLNASVYWLTFSPFLQPFTVKPKTTGEGKDERLVPLDMGPGGLLYAIGELVRLQQPDLSDLFAQATGGRSLSFLKKNALEQAVQLVGDEVHRQYLLSYEPKGSEPGRFHAIRVTVRNRPELQVKTRAGYWAVQ